MASRPPRKGFSFTALALLLGGACCFGYFQYQLHHQPFLQRFYARDFVVSGLASIKPNFSITPKPQPVYPVIMAALSWQLPLPSGLCPADTLLPSNEDAVVTPGFAANHQVCTQFTTRKALYAWLQQNVYHHSLGDYLTGNTAKTFAYLMAVCLAAGLVIDKRRFRRKLDGKVLRGPLLMSTREYNRRTKGDGFKIRLDILPKPRNPRLAGWVHAIEPWIIPASSLYIRLLKEDEPTNILTMADPGGGKSSLFKQILDQLEQRGNEVAIVHDPHMEYVERYYRPERGDVILNPLDSRCPSWGPAYELDLKDEKMASARALAQAVSLFPGKRGDRDWFFVYVDRLFWQYCVVNYQPTVHQMAELMANADPLIDRIIEGTEVQIMMADNAPAQRAAVVAHLSQIAQSLRQLPNLSSDQVPAFTVRDWCNHRKGWVFITNTPDTRESLRAIQSMWLDLFILTLMSQGKRPDLPPVLMAIDELQTLFVLPQLMPLMTEGRKTMRALVGFQGRSQIKDLYGETAEAIFSAAYTKFFMRTSEESAAKWVQGMIGDVEIERWRETVPAHILGKSGHSYSREQIIQPLLLYSQFQGIKNRVGYFKNGNAVTRFTIAYVAQRNIALGFVPNVGVPVQKRELPSLGELKAEKLQKELTAALAKQEKLMNRDKRIAEADTERARRASISEDIRQETLQRAREANARSLERHEAWKAKQKVATIPIVTNPEKERRAREYYDTLTKADDEHDN